MNNTALDINTLESWLWEAACKIRGEIDAPKYKDYILPLIFLKRLSDVFDDEMKGLQDEYGNMKVAEEIARKDHSVLRFKQKYYKNASVAPLRFYGQEINHITYAMARMNAFLHDMEANIAIGDTMHTPKFLNPDGSLMKFDKVTANPMWNQDFAQSTYENDPYNRFVYGYPPSSSADWGWIQHMAASLTDKGKMAVVLDTGAVSRGSGNQGANRERDIRKAFVDKDWVEAVILMPENLFYNTTAPGIILVINKKKKHKGEVILINASKLFSKGRPKNYLTDENIQQVYRVYSKWKDEEGISKVIKNEEAVKNDYNLSPSRYVSQNGAEEVLPLEEAIVLLKEAEEERAAADKRLGEILSKMGFDISAEGGRQ